MKKCTRCQVNYEVERFPIVNSKTGKRSSLHDECKREYDREHYHKHKDRLKEPKSESGKKFFYKRRQHIVSVLKSSECNICRNNDWRVLEFHHRDSTLKSFNVADGAKHSLEKINKEIEKCDILCANCHRIETISQRGYYKYENGL